MTKSQRVSNTPAEQLLHPFQEFLHQESSGGILLLLFTTLALLWANSPWAESYNALWQAKLTIGAEAFSLSKPLILWINDGLMAIFFFVVGLEIKREVLVGELASLKKAILPAAAAIGGMLVPAAIYALFNRNGPGAAGWGIPMATDIAFALGVLALLGNRASLPLKVFLTALAIVDDLGAVLVIALFYTAHIAWNSLAIAGVFLLLLIVTNRLGVRHPLIYALLGIGLWVAFLLSGVHATIAGVLLAMTIPAKASLSGDEFAAHSRAILEEFDRERAQAANGLNEIKQSALQTLEDYIQRVESPLQRLEHSLHPWVAFAIVPLFALANAGVALSGDLVSALTQPISLGIATGLVLGKQVGVSLFAWLTVRFGLAALPKGVSWRHIYGASWLAGIGFTMSLFIAGLAFGQGPELTAAKLGILVASLLAGLTGWLLLRNTPVSANR